MNKLSADPLLAAAQILLFFLIGVLAFAAIALTIALPLVLIFQEQVFAAMAAEGLADADRLALPAALVVAAVVGLLALTVYFLVLLRRIVSSVGEGDPFVPANADRLRRMGWTALIAQCIAVPIGAAVMWIAVQVGDEVENVHVENEMGFSLTGVLLVLILFILARVFRHGAAMRDDLEGTV